MFGRGPISSAPICGTPEATPAPGPQVRLRARDQGGPMFTAVDTSEGQP